MFSEVAASLMLANLPEGYEIITEGKAIPGDIRWNKWEDCWNTQAPLESPKHDIVIGDSVKTFAGICRKTKTR